MTKNILLIGNGPSTKLLLDNFKNISKKFSTLGTSLAFRYYQKINWFPDYYVLADSKVVLARQDEIKNTFLDNNFNLENLYLSYKVSGLDHKVINHSTTGCAALDVSNALGYKNIYLIGIENSYVEKLNEARKLSMYEKYFKLKIQNLDLPRNSKKLYKITNTVKENPNYFINDYQQIGDIYSKPNSNSHKKSFETKIEEFLATQINIYDLNPNSTLKLPIKDIKGIIK
jgi:hypothetical protein